MAARNGTEGGTFENPAKPADFTPLRDTSHAPGYDDGDSDSPDTGAFSASSGFEPLGYDGWTGHEERSDFLAATGVDHDSDDVS